MPRNGRVTLLKMCCSSFRDVRERIALEEKEGGRQVVRSYKIAMMLTVRAIWPRLVPKSIDGQRHIEAPAQAWKCFGVPLPATSNGESHEGRYE